MQLAGFFPKNVFVFLACILFALPFYAQENHPNTIKVAGKAMEYKTFNFENRKEGSPILVFESGLGGGTFDPLLPFFPKNISGIQYNRNGIENSEPDANIITDSQLVERLHLLLKTLKINPPYLLVGHSIGGPYMRLFAAKFPDEVCGMVLSDPTDFMLTKFENEQAKLLSKSATGYQELLSVLVEGMAKNENFSEGTKYDAKRALKANANGYFNEYVNLPKLNPAIATTVLISYNKNVEQPDEELNQSLNLGINLKEWWQQYDQLRIQHYAEMIKDNNNSQLVLLPKYSHGIYYQNPKMVAQHILQTYQNCSN